MCENPEPKPADEKPAPEIRGGNRPTDYIPPKKGRLIGEAYIALHNDDDSVDEDSEED